MRLPPPPRDSNPRVENGCELEPHVLRRESKNKITKKNFKKQTQRTEPIPDESDLTDQLYVLFWFCTLEFTAKFNAQKLMGVTFTKLSWRVLGH